MKALIQETNSHQMILGVSLICSIFNSILVLAFTAPPNTKLVYMSGGAMPNRKIEPYHFTLALINYCIFTLFAYSVAYLSGNIV